MVKEYSLHMNSGDKKDRNTSNWGVSVKPKRYYMRIFYFIFNRVLQAMFVTIKFSLIDDKNDAKDDALFQHKYMERGIHRYEFQIDLGIELIIKVLEMDWGNPHEEVNQKPVYIRKQHYIPCGCKKCFL